MKLNSLETTTKGLVADLKQFKNHANDTAAALAQYKQKLTELEKILEIQNQNLDSLQAAMKSLTDALQVKNNFSGSSEKTYKIAPGDSLKKSPANIIHLFKLSKILTAFPMIESSWAKRSKCHEK